MNDIGNRPAIIHLMASEEAANFLCIKLSTLYAWVHQRRVPFRKHGTRIVFCREDLQRWSDAQRVEPLPDNIFADKSTIRSLKTRHTVNEHLTSRKGEGNGNSRKERQSG